MLRLIKRKTLLMILAALFVSAVSSRANSNESLNINIPPLLINTLKFAFNSKSDACNVRGNLISSASKYIGTPYRFNGTSPGGFDCSGYVRFIYQKFGYNLAHSSRALASTGDRVSRENAQPGDLVLFAYRGNVHHVAMVYSNIDGDLKIIHSCNSKGVAIESVDGSNYWKQRLYTIRRIL